MKNTFLLLAFISIFLSNNKVIAQCAVAEKYVADIQNFQDNATPTEYASSGKKISAWTQFATWNTYKCQCDSPENLSDSEIPQLVNAMNATRGIISKEYSTYGTVPRVYKVSDCKKGNSNSTNSASSKTSTQIEMEKRFQNYNNAMNLKRQGENIAKAFAQQVKSYGELNNTNSPEALLQSFNSNMQAIADLQTQNKADNLDQLTNTLNSTINDLNSGNHEGAMFSALSLLDQGEAKREARREAEIVKQNLIYQTQKNMTAFYWKAVDLNNQAIKQYYEKAAYAYSKEEETYLLEYVSNLECHKNYMETNFNYSSTAWTQNKCSVPEKKTYSVNNLIAKDIQYINAAKRKYALYEKTGEPIFQQGAMRFAGLAAAENPKTEYYYLMGHFAGTNNPLVAYSSFLTAESKNVKYFEGEKLAEFAIAKTSLELYFKKAIEENNQEVIKNIVGANLHRTISIDGYLPIIYAIKIDQADVVYAFLNTELEGKPQSVINRKVQSTLFMSAILDAPKTIQKFVDLGFSINFSINSKTPLDAAEESLAIKSFDKISKLLGGQSKYNFENSDAIKVRDLLEAAELNDTIKVVNIFDSFTKPKSKLKSIEVLLYAKNRESFFLVFEANELFFSDWARENRGEIYYQFCNEILYKNNQNVYKYISLDIISFQSGINLGNEDLEIFFQVWVNNSWDVMSLSFEETKKRGLFEDFIRNPQMAQRRDELVGVELGTNYAKMMNVEGTLSKDWGKTSLFDYLVSDPMYYHMNLVTFAIYFRQDSKLLGALLEKYQYTLNDYTYITGQHYNISPKSRLGDNDDLLKNIIKWGLILDPSYKHNRMTTKKDYPILYQNGYEILSMVIFDFGYNNNAFKLLANMKFNDNLKPEADQYLKTLIDKLIETGQANKNWNITWSKGWKKEKQKQIKKDVDQQYWNAILDGDFESRYK